MKTIIKLSLCLCSTFAMGWCVTYTYFHQDRTNLSILENIEALSQSSESEDFKREYKGKADGDECYITDPVTNKVVKGKRVSCYWTGNPSDICFEGACGRVY